MDSGILWKTCTVKSFSQLSLKGPFGLFIRVTIHWGKENNQTFWGLPVTGSELTPIPGDPKCYYGSPRVGPYGGLVIDGILAQACLMVSPVGS